MNIGRQRTRQRVAGALLGALLVVSAGGILGQRAEAQVDASRAGPGAMPDYDTPTPFQAASGKYGFEMKPEDV